MKKIFMSGCGGMLGDAFYNVFKNTYKLKCTDIDINEDWLEYLDFRNFDEYSKSVDNFSPTSPCKNDLIKFRTTST